MIKNGDKVSLDYEGRLETGEIFDSSKHGDHSHPLEFQIGSGQVIPGFEKAVLGMQVGQEKEFTLKPEEAYGMPDAAREKQIPRTMLPPEQEPKVGMMLVMQTPDGKQVPMRISRVDKENITLDLNHPLAGKTLVFKVTILKIN
ncbi:peptidylprolyl isomerase [Candidatus Pacearchaeota archaeon]|nr:peptidylprolyl isomerase [Candidatus Pacearchaeota archaeon]